MKIQAYPPEIEAQMRNFYSSVLQCDAGTVSRGVEKLKDTLLEKEQRTQRPCGGRILRFSYGKRAGCRIFKGFLTPYCRFAHIDPVKWTNLSWGKIANKLAQQDW